MIILKDKACKEAKRLAFRDIAKECKKQKKGRNYLNIENLVCEYAGVKKPDFRKFNGKGLK